MSTHTPGPWRAKPCLDRPSDSDRCDGIVPDYHNHEGDNCYDYDREGFEACPATVEIVTTDSGYYGPRWANAILIAAAPDYWAAVEQLSTDYCELSGDDAGYVAIPKSACDALLRAHAKAEGRSNE